jgi:hypothetical protein
MLKYILAWLPMIPIAIGNALLREKVIAAHVDELLAHQVSCATGMLLLGVYIWAVVRIWRPDSAGQSIGIGLIWLGLTLAFEFLFGHYVMGNTWGRLLHDYDIFAGRLWLLVILWITLAPYTFYRLHR